MTTIRPPSNTLSFEDAISIWPKIWNNEYLNRIAADYDVNPGRISEIKTEKSHMGSFDAAAQRFGYPKGFRRKRNTLPLFNTLWNKGKGDA